MTRPTNPKSLTSLVCCVFFATIASRIAHGDETIVNDAVLASDVSHPINFESSIAPLIVRECLECHTSEDPSGGLDLSNRDGWIRGGESGEVIDFESSELSYLLERIRSHEMPPPVRGTTQVIPDSDYEKLERWIEKGLPWPENRVLDYFERTNEKRAGRDWWSLQPLAYQPDESLETAFGLTNPIDALIQKRLTKEGLVPAPTAKRVQLIRRIYYTLHGLPPTADQRSRHLADQSPNWWENLVDELLDRPEYGQRWARYWLDVVRYADTSGYERDQEKPFAWKYRDWVVDALNDDMPYADFVRLQLAADQYSVTESVDLTPTGFLRLGTWNDEPNEPAKYQYERLEDLVHTTSSAFLGLTVKCARCHSHKFDPISQDDYYRFASIFWTGPVDPQDKKWLGGPDPASLQQKNLLAWVDTRPQQPPLHVFKNGDPDSPLWQVEMRTPSFVPSLSRSIDKPSPKASTSGYRREMAEWIVDHSHPLTWRVIANRIWQQHFGVGIVATSNNFGFQGAEPTHPELLDWLAAYLIREHGSLKSLHRLILNSSTWRQSVEHPQPEIHNHKDAGNRLLWRANRQRLDAEAIRDAMLSATGELDLRLGGPGFYGEISEQALAGLSKKSKVWTPSPPSEQRRRSLYQFIKRGLMPPMMRTFDLCEANQSVGRRDVTTVPTQALTLMNHQFVHERSENLSKQLQATKEPLDAQIRSMWRSLLHREIEPDELKDAIEFVRQQSLELAQQVSRSNSAEAGHRTLSSTTLHLSASSLKTDSDTGRVLAILDQSKQENHALQFTSVHQPVLSDRTWNGNPVLWFDGNKRYLKLQSKPIEDSLCTLIAVLSDEGGPGHREIISNWNSSSNVGTSFFVGLTNQDTIRISDAFSSAGGITNRSKPFIISVVSDTSTVQVYQSGRQIAEMNAGLPQRKFHTPWVIGQQGNINGEYWHGGIAELIMIPRALSGAERNAVEQTLGKKYGIAITKASEPADAETLALSSLARVLFNSNEFIYLD